MNNKLFHYFIIFVLIVMNVFYLYHTNKLTKEINKLRTEQNRQTITLPLNQRTLEFLSLFIKKILKAEKEVDFDTRLMLENKVRELNDKEILEAWNKFVNSKSEDEAQKNVKDLLDILVDKSLNK